MAFAWTDEVLARMRRLWCVEGASASQIAAELGITRNAVSGKIDRLGWRQSSELPRQPRREHTAPRLRARKPLPSRLIVEEPTGPLTLLDLRSGQCRWPLGGWRDPPVHFCGAPHVVGKAYCAEHCARAFIPARPSKIGILGLIDASRVFVPLRAGVAAE